jgi:hypothetical protein
MIPQDGMIATAVTFVVAVVDDDANRIGGGGGCRRL